jgi:hypothetical protein
MKTVKTYNIVNNKSGDEGVHRKENRAMLDNRISVKIGTAVLAAAAALSLAPRHAVAASEIFTLTDMNSSVSVNPDDDSSQPGGLYNWMIDGVSQVASGRVGQRYYLSANSSSAAPLDALDISSSTPPSVLLESLTGGPDNNYAQVTYTGSGFTVIEEYILNGGPAGSDFSDLTEQVTITNLSSTKQLPFTIDDYTDLNLGGNGSNDTVTISHSGGTAKQTDAAGWIATASAATAPSDYQTSLYSSLLSALNGGAIGLSTLPPTVVSTGPGDVADGLEFAIKVQPGSSVCYSVDQQIVGPGPSGPMPEPTSSAAFIGLGSLFLIRRRRRDIAA